MELLDFRNSNYIDANLRSFGISHGMGYLWYMNNPKSLNISNIHNIFKDCFKDFVITSYETKLTSKEELFEKNGFGLGYKVYIKDTRNKIQRYEYSGNQLQLSKGKNEDTIILTNSINFYSDFVWNSKTKKFIDFSDFAEKNRSVFNSSLLSFKIALECKVIYYEPKVGQYTTKMGKLQKQVNDFLGEEIDENGFKALTHRRELYLKQEEEKNKKPFWKIF